MTQPSTPTRRVLITAGPTHEPIDAVRYLANRSSGRLGTAIAEAAAAAGHATTLLLGPTCLTPMESTRLTVQRFHSTADLQQLLHTHWPSHDLLIMAAAVADYRPVGSGSGDPPMHKIPRESRRITLELEPTPDLLAELAGQSRPNQLLIGFALGEADTLLDAARRKLREKRVHAIIANPLQTMDADSIDATILLATGETLEPPKLATKADFAAWLIEHLPAIADAAT